MIEPLKEVLARTDDPELRAYSATVLLTFGDKSVIPLLLELLSTEERYLCPIAHCLARAQVVEAGDRMIERLRTLGYTEKVDMLGIQCLLMALKDLGRTLPPDLIERFQQPDVPFWEIRIYMEKLFL
ncbi:MAG TPA: HEAT repeat domain-containing protein [Ktedonobacteraceae bacterium]|nr:HEAT repeat domain-containing protein [Ktedonobacteraceae bacterium]